MSKHMGRVPFITNGIYHLYNHGVEDRLITNDRDDSDRFRESLYVFNTVEPVGSMYEYEIRNKNEMAKEQDPLVDIIAYCINPNHFHMLVRQRVDGGAGEFLKRVIGGYTWYFNNKNERSGVLMQGRTRARQVHENGYIRYLVPYIDLNNHVHGLPAVLNERVRNSWKEHTEQRSDKITRADDLFRQGVSQSQYAKHAEQTVAEIARRRHEDSELYRLCID